MQNYCNMKRSVMRVTSGPGNCSDGNLWLSELGPVSGVDNVAHHGQLTPSTQGVSVHCSLLAKVQKITIVLYYL